MSKITNDNLTQSGTGCFTAVPILQQWRGRVNKIELQEQTLFLQDNYKFFCSQNDTFVVF